MLIAVSCTGSSMDHDLDPRFGRAESFLLVDSETLTSTVLDNQARAASGGAGIAAAQVVIDHQAQAVITGQLGPNAMNVLEDADIELYQGIPGTVRENIEACKLGQLTRITKSGPSHAGMGHHGGRP